MRMLVTGGLVLSWVAVSGVVLKEGIVHVGGVHTRWIGIGSGGLVPHLEPGLYWVASRITLMWAGLTFVLLQGVPVCSLLHSATLLRLWDSRHSPSEQRLVLTVEEYQSIQEQRLGVR
jgi:hypothetical protein